MQNIFKIDESIVIYADTREISSKVTDILKRKCELREKKLEVADYLLSNRVAAERKTTSDFLQSIIDGRLFKQLAELKNNFDSPILIIEGTALFNNDRKIHENAVRGALASIAIDFRIPILWAESQHETAELLFAVAKREQLIQKNTIAIRGKKKMRSDNEQQRFIVAGLPGISTVTAEKLLKHFKTPEAIFCAPETELQKIEGIGKDMSRKIKYILTKKYEKSILDD